MKIYRGMETLQVPIAGKGFEWAATKCGDAKEAEARLEDGYRMLLSRHGGDVEMVFALQQERTGGECKYCHKAFTKKTCGALYWFEPACRCFKRCAQVRTPEVTFQGCGRLMVYEKYKGIDQCIHCYPAEQRKHDESKAKTRTERNVRRKVAE